MRQGGSLSVDIDRCFAILSGLIEIQHISEYVASMSSYGTV